MSTEPGNLQKDFSEIIAENFGANATYVETLLARWRSDPALVDESWRAYFEALVGAHGDRATASQPSEKSVAPPRVAETDGDATAPAKKQTSEPPAASGPLR